MRFQEETHFCVAVWGKEENPILPKPTFRSFRYFLNYLAGGGCRMTDAGKGGFRVGVWSPLSTEWNDSGVCSGSPKTTARYSWNSGLLIYSSFPFPALHTTLNCGESSFSGACEMGWSFSLKESALHSVLRCSLLCGPVRVPPLMSVAPWARPWSFPSSCWENWKCLVKPHTDCLDSHPGRPWFPSLLHTPQVPNHWIPL